MPKMGRPKIDNPIKRSVTIKFMEEEYQKMVAYAASVDVTSISRFICLCAEKGLQQNCNKF